MTKVRFTFNDIEGKPLQNMEFTLLLNRASFNEKDTGVILPESLTVTTDALGQAIVELWPLKAAYKIRIAEEYEEVCGKLNWSFYVPDNAGIIEAQDLFMVPPPSNTSWDEEAMALIADAKSATAADAIRAETAANDAELALSQMGDNAERAEAAATAALFSRDEAGWFSNRAHADADIVAADKALTLGYKEDAALNAQNANTSKIGAEAARNTAVQNAATTTSDRQTVTADKALVAADKGTVAADKAIVAADKAIVIASMNTTTAARDVATAARDEAVAAAGAVAGVISDGGSIDLSGGVYPPKPMNSTVWRVSVGGTVTGTDGDTYGVGDSLFFTKAQNKFWKLDNTESVFSVNGQTGVVTLTKASVGLGNVDNTSDANKPVSTAQKAVNDAQDSVIAGKEPSLGTSAASSYLTGTKAWADFAGAVRSAIMSGLNVTIQTAVVATDNVITAFSKLQGQLNWIYTNKAGAGANTDITSLVGLTTPLSQAQGGTGKSSMGAAAVGAVGYSGGVPTGAILEEGSNQFGSYTKYANGKLECFHEFGADSGATTAAGVGFNTTPTNWTFPYAFDVTNRTVLFTGAANSGGGYIALIGPPTATYASFQRTSMYSDSTGRGVRVKAEGRWRP